MLHNNETTLLLCEVYRRVYPVVRTSSDLVLATAATELTEFTAI